MQYFTYWEGLERPTWEHEEELTQYGNCVFGYWAGEPVQVKGENAKYRLYRVEMIKRAIARAKGERHVPAGYAGYVVCCDTRKRPSLYTPHTPHIVGSYIFFNTTHTGWQLARVVGIAEDNVNNCWRGARRLVLARAPENQKRQELQAIAGVGRAWTGGRYCTGKEGSCLLYTSPSPRDGLLSRMPSSA